MVMLPHDCQQVVDSDKARFRLLYVGEDIELLRALRKVLTTPDYHIVSCSHVGTALLFLEGDPRYDLLLFELELRGKTGIQLAREVRQIRHRGRLPIIIVKSKETVADLVKLRRPSGVDNWVTKRDVPACVETIIKLLGLEAPKICSSLSMSGTVSS